MARRRAAFGGWALTGWTGLALVAMLGAIALTVGTDEEGVRMGIRATARSSLLLFGLAFTASSLRRLSPGRVSAWLLRNRRYLGVSFAISHGLHLVGILDLALRFPEGFDPPPTTLFFGGLGYLFVAAMTATSFDRSAAWLGRQHWTLLHRSGSWLLWFVLAASFVPNALAGSPVHLPFAMLALAMPALRGAAALRVRRGAASVQAVGGG